MAGVNRPIALFRISPYADWLPIIRRLEATRIAAPQDLAAVPFANISRLVDDWPEKDAILHLWLAASVATEPRGGRLTSLPLTPNAAFAANTFRVRDIDTAAPSNRRPEMMGEFPHSGEFRPYRARGEDKIPIAERH